MPGSLWDLISAWWVWRQQQFPGGGPPVPQSLEDVAKMSMPEIGLGPGIVKFPLAKVFRSGPFVHLEKTAKQAGATGGSASRPGLPAADPNFIRQGFMDQAFRSDQNVMADIVRLARSGQLPLDKFDLLVNRLTGPVAGEAKDLGALLGLHRLF